MTKDITIQESRFYELIVAEEKLNRLIAGGVDCWDGYQEALNPEDDLFADWILALNKIMRYNKV